MSEIIPIGTGHGVHLLVKGHVFDTAQQSGDILRGRRSHSHYWNHSHFREFMATSYITDIAMHTRPYNTSAFRQHGYGRQAGKHAEDTLFTCSHASTCLGTLGHADKLLHASDMQACLALACTPLTCKHAFNIQAYMLYASIPFGMHTCARHLPPVRKSVQINLSYLLIGSVNPDHCVGSTLRGTSVDSMCTPSITGLTPHASTPAHSTFLEHNQSSVAVLQRSSSSSVPQVSFCL